METMVMDPTRGSPLDDQRGWLKRLVQDRTSKEYIDLRDRAAYAYATGAFPSHLRKTFTGMLRMIMTYSREPESLDGSSGSMKIDPEVVEALELNNHPMIRKTREFIERGYKIQVARGLTARRPYTKLFLFSEADDRPQDKVTIQVDGSVKEGW